MSQRTTFYLCVVRTERKNVTPCILVQIKWYFGETFCLFTLWYFWRQEHGSSTLLRNTVEFIPRNTASVPAAQYSSRTLAEEPQSTLKTVQLKVYEKKNTTSRNIPQWDEAWVEWRSKRRTGNSSNDTNVSLWPKQSSLQHSKHILNS